MATDGLAETLGALAQKMNEEYTQSEYEIAEALAAADDPLTIGELAEATGYTERTIRKRVGTLEEELGGSPLIERDDQDRPYLHPELAAAIRAAH